MSRTSDTTTALPSRHTRRTSSTFVRGLAFGSTLSLAVVLVGMLLFAASPSVRVLSTLYVLTAFAACATVYTFTSGPTASERARQARARVVQDQLVLKYSR